MKLFKNAPEIESLTFENFVDDIFNMEIAKSLIKVSFKVGYLRFTLEKPKFPSLEKVEIWGSLFVV